MDKKLQKTILRVIKENNGHAEWKLILSKAQRIYWENNLPPSSGFIIKHQMDLLQAEDKIIREDQLPHIYYILMPKGYEVFDSRYKKFYKFLFYEKNNIYTILSVLISIGSLIISIIAFKSGR